MKLYMDISKFGVLSLMADQCSIHNTARNCFKPPKILSHYVLSWLNFNIVIWLTFFSVSAMPATILMFYTFDFYVAVLFSPFLVTAFLSDNVNAAITCAKRVVRDPQGISAW